MQLKTDIETTKTKNVPRRLSYIRIIYIYNNSDKVKGITPQDHKIQDTNSYMETGLLSFKKKNKKKGGGRGGGGGQGTCV